MVVAPDQVEGGGALGISNQESRAATAVLNLVGPSRLGPHFSGSQGWWIETERPCTLLWRESETVRFSAARLFSHETTFDIHSEICMFFVSCTVVRASFEKKFSNCFLGELFSNREYETVSHSAKNSWAAYNVCFPSAGPDLAANVAFSHTCYNFILIAFSITTEFGFFSFRYNGCEKKKLYPPPFI